jgi:DNA-binding XRE family transcriptional regulator
MPPAARPAVVWMDHGLTPAAATPAVNLPGLSYRYYYSGMVRDPLQPWEIERGRCLGAALRQARGSATLGEVAAAAGVSVETLRKIEMGRIPTPAFFTVAAVADVLGLSLDDLSAGFATPDGRTRGPACSTGRPGSWSRVPG